MKLELGMGGGAFKDEDKAMVASVLGTKALDDKGSSSVSKENLLTTICSDENLQNKLSGLVDRPNASNFSWNNAQNMKKNVLQKLHTLFGGLDEDNYALGLDSVNDTEMFFLASTYYLLPPGEGGPGKCFASGKHVWNLDALKSVTSVLESLELLQSIRSSFSTKSELLRAKQVRVAIPMVNEKIDENTLVSNSTILERLLGDPKIFGQDLNNATWHGHSNYREKLAVRPTCGAHVNGGRLSFLSNQNGLHWPHVHSVKQGSTIEFYNIFEATSRPSVITWPLGVEFKHLNIEAPCKEEKVSVANERRPRKRGGNPANGREEALNHLQAELKIVKAEKEKLGNTSRVSPAIDPNLNAENHT
ncbi:hypothetical protein ES288_D08G167100v1 [Gossypium darwinii]|uniref:Transcription factor n=2 Tax=Gossypium TaxID=3633 RepID=A0A5D2BQA3_GOSDA|nr:hypothetical protein ES288_D08G167100v1 [Gossypium darwinii]